MPVADRYDLGEVTAEYERLTVGSERHPVCVVIDLQYALHLAGRGVPQSQGAVVAARRKTAAVGAVCEGGDDVRVSAERHGELAGRQVPDRDRLVRWFVSGAAARDASQASPLRTEYHAGDPGLVAPKPQHLRSRIGVADGDASKLFRHRETLPVRAESDSSQTQRRSGDRQPVPAACHT